MSWIAVIDYGMGNLHSISKALQHVAPAADIRVGADREIIRGAERVVFPGVGAIRDCIAEINRLDLVPTLTEAAATKPFLGVCVGMQALFSHSEENQGVDCLDIVPGQVRYFGDEPRDPRDGARLKVPHMGWNEVVQSMQHPLWEGIAPNSRFYFVHGYYAQPDDPGRIAGATDYGCRFAAAVAQRNVFAVQFHPEKSHRAGLRLLENFVGWSGQS